MFSTVSNLNNVVSNQRKTIKALQELEENQNVKLEEMESKHNEEITLMNNKIATLEEFVRKLIDEKSEQP
ncbi:hypothetical protein P4T34_27805 [Bacillus mobilis]|uniref:hypothetical protein n=1 Tax=Bacillus mobilis TaxID=2026190 RepID=UPI002E1A39C1|nr:hypothetical protein [Bacillus mobilis]MED0999211.1 hypothetical protein [Bacillus mobilis]MED1004745.1 hypothetical protein [Bacillus mobilis]